MASYTGDRMMLVYEHKTNGRILVSGGLSILDEEGLVLIISANPDIRVVTKNIKPGVTSVDLYKADLLSTDENLAAAKEAKVHEAEATEEVPWKVFFGHEWEGHSFGELTILVPESAEQNLKLNSKAEATVKAT